MAAGHTDSKRATSRADVPLRPLQRAPRRPPWCRALSFARYEMIRWRRYDHAVTLCAFDLLELDGTDIRREPIEERKRLLTKLLRRPHPGIALNEHYDQ